MTILSVDRVLRLAAVLLAHVRGDDRERRLGHAGAEDLRAEIEFVIAGREDVDPEPVEDVDDVGALVDAGEERGRKRVAGMDEEGRALGALGLDQGGEAGEAAAPVELLHAVDVVGLDEGDRELFGERLADHTVAREKRDCGEPQDA